MIRLGLSTSAAARSGTASSLKQSCGRPRVRHSTVWRLRRNEKEMAVSAHVSLRSLRARVEGRRGEGSGSLFLGPRV